METIYLMYYILVMGVGIGIFATLAYKIWMFFKYLIK